MDTVVRLPAAAFVSLPVVRRCLGPRNRELHASDTFGNFESCYPLAAVEHVRHKSVGELGLQHANETQFCPLLDTVTESSDSLISLVVVVLLSFAIVSIQGRQSLSISQPGGSSFFGLG